MATAICARANPPKSCWAFASLKAGIRARLVFRNSVLILKYSNVVVFLIVVVALSRSTCAQQTGVLGRPAPTLPPVPESIGHDLESFDSFAPLESQGIQLRPWQTIDVPFASWGSEIQWSPETLHGTTIDYFRKKFVQKVDLSGGWVARNGDHSYGYSFATAAITMVVPLGSENNVVLFTPSFRTDWLSGPTQIDVPPRLYSSWLDIGWRLKFSEQLATIVGVRPGWFSDGHSSENTIRTSGLFIVSYDSIPNQLKWIVGVVYLDRNDFNLLPAVGVNWRPTADKRFDITFPRPKIAKRVGHIPYVLEDWIYVAGFIGGNTWSVQRLSGLPDELTLADYRISFGIERIIQGGTGFNFEVGYAFARSLEYQSNGIRIDVNGTLVIETGLRF